MLAVNPSLESFPRESDVLWTRSPDADENLLREGVAAERIDLIGNIMIDSFEILRDRIDASTIRKDLGLKDKQYGLVTPHRASNVDQAETLAPIVEALTTAAKDLPLVFVAHRRTIASLDKLGLKEKLTASGDIQLLEPLRYIKFMHVVTGSKVVITDSGGLQEETTYLGIPCMTMRQNTERPITSTQGTNRLVRVDNLAQNLAKVMAGDWPQDICPPLWDGKTASRRATPYRCS